MRPGLVFLAWLACACGSPATPPAAPPPPSVVSTPDEVPAEAGAVAAHPPREESSRDAAPEPAREALKLTFPERGGVEAAIKAVPRGAPRLNMSDDVLQAPLLEMRRYDRCKVPRTTKVVLTVAVYDGSAVGVDVETQPVNAKLNECLDRVVREMSWEKVPSLNQVSVSF